MAYQKIAPLAKIRKDLSAEYVRMVLDYCPDTGIFTHREHESAPQGWNEKWGGKRASSSLCHGYRRIGISGKSYLAHRIEWLWMTGEWPEYMVDHIDGNPRNNKWSNLRSVSHAQNQWNHKTFSSNKSGFTGVNFHRGKWRATICSRHIGYFCTKEEAHRAYLNAAQAERGEFVRGNDSTSNKTQSEMDFQI